jgi:hypothetical protein
MASFVFGDLANLFRDAGRYEEALRVLGQKADNTKRAEFGPWTQLADEAWRLQILVLRGENEAVLLRVTELREQMKTLPDPAGPNEQISIWNVRETIFDIGRASALRLGEWQQALDFGREMQQSKRERGALSLELAIAAFNDYAPLLRLKQYDAADRLLRHCREEFERENSIEMLGKVFSALADLEANIGRPLTAQQFEETAFRYKYTQDDPDNAAVSHFNISNYIIGSRGEWRDAFAHRLAAVLINVAMQSGRAVGNFAALVHDLRNPGAVRDGRKDRRGAVLRDDRASCRRPGRIRPAFPAGCRARPRRSFQTGVRL